MKKLLLTGTIVLLTAVSASAGPEAEHRGHWVSPGQWQMNDIGRNHGVRRTDAVASAPNVSAARIATKANVLLSRPAIMTLPCRCPATDNSRRKYSEKFPATGQLE